MGAEVLSDLATHHIGGGWGTESPTDDNTLEVAVIRGTDIPRLRYGDVSTVPMRYESEKRAKVRELQAGDLVIEVSGGSAAKGQHTGRALFVSDKLLKQFEVPVIPASFCRLLRLDGAQVSGRYLYYQISAMHQSKEIAIFENRSTGISNFQFKRFIEKVSPTLESLGAQERVADILGTLDDKIEINRQMSRTLEAMARAIFKAWFVDFEPVKAKAAGANSFRGMPQPVFDQLPDRFTDTDLGPVPDGWEVKPLDEIADFLNGIPLQKYPASSSEEGLPVIKIAELRNGVSARSEQASRQVPRKYIVNDGDFLFSWSGSLLAKFWTEGEGALNQHLFKVTSTTYPLWFVSEWVQRHLRVFQGIASSKATTMGHIQRRHIKEAMTVCPPHDLLDDMGQVMSPLIEKMIAVEVESRTLAAIRDTLLPKLISGEIRVAPAEANADGR